MLVFHSDYLLTQLVTSCDTTGNWWPVYLQLWHNWWPINLLTQLVTNLLADATGDRFQIFPCCVCGQASPQDLTVLLLTCSGSAYVRLLSVASYFKSCADANCSLRKRDSLPVAKRRGMCICMRCTLLRGDFWLHYKELLIHFGKYRSSA